MRQLLLGVVFVLTVLGLTLWAAGTAYFHVHASLSIACLLAALILMAVYRRSPRRAWLGVLAGFAITAVGWSMLMPLPDRDWADEVSRMPRYQRDGSMLHLSDVRDFAWTTRDDYEARWIDKRVDLDQLVSLDVAISYWMGPAIAHTLVSFGFADGQFLTFSVEIRRERHERFDALAGFFRSYERALIVAEERDILRVRADVRQEQLYLYRVDLPPEAMRGLLEAYLQELDELHQTARFYNTLTANCTTVVLELVRRAVGEVPMDWRILLSGYLDDYLYEKGRLDSTLNFKELKARSRVPTGSRIDLGAKSYSSFIRG